MSILEKIIDPAFTEPINQSGAYVSIRLQLQYPNETSSLERIVYCSNYEEACIVRDALERQINSQIANGNEYILIGELKTRKGGTVRVLHMPLRIRRSNIMAVAIAAVDLPGGDSSRKKAVPKRHKSGIIGRLMRHFAAFGEQFKDAD